MAIHHISNAMLILNQSSYFIEGIVDKCNITNFGLSQVTKSKKKKKKKKVAQTSKHDIHHKTLRENGILTERGKTWSLYYEIDVILLFSYPQVPDSNTRNIESADKCKMH